MTTDEYAMADAVERALDTHDAFEPGADGYVLETTVFDVSVTATAAEGERDGAFEVTVVVPTLSAAAVDHVAEIVETDWAETFERHVQDAFTVARTSTHDEPVVERTDDSLRVKLAFTAWDATEGVSDAKALAEYVEGTYAQGLIPGYEYRGPARSLQTNAQQRGQEPVDGGGPPL
ncbi:DUF5813 family protein [Halovivax gelatinilyticus]|uniref:DUF5813 family protein n=1 Tax=Halovivax gelatinilyticus TaxID=2961597 RepID=UPI0020CA71D7|nr:DUF5813 family protein [Halovivax gelatinilyticus]